MMYVHWAERACLGTTAELYKALGCAMSKISLLAVDCHAHTGMPNCGRRSLHCAPSPQKHALSMQSGVKYAGIDRYYNMKLQWTYNL